MERKPIPDRFKGKTAIVTGGTSGIGKSVVEELCKEGAFVVFTGRSESGYAVKEELDGLGYHTEFCRGDMSDADFCRYTVQRAAELTGKVNYLLNNAFSFLGKGEDVTTEDFLIMYQAGPFAYARMVQNCAPHMRRQGGGSIVNMSSISAHIAQVNRWTYNSAKGAVNQITKCMAMDLGKDNIRVNSVSPAYTWTRELERGANLDGGGREKWDPIWAKLHMLRRCAEAVEVAAPILFLFSDDASFITGSDIRIDGGYISIGAEGMGDVTANAGTK